MDILFESTYLRFSRRNKIAQLQIVEAVRTYLKAILERITAGASRVILMVGSNRQSVGLDRYNRGELEREVGPVPSDVGWVRVDFENLAASMGWELNKAMLSDKKNGVPPGTAWADERKLMRIPKGKDHLLKKRILEYQFSQLRGTVGPIDFYFFDDNVHYLDYVREELANSGAIPSSMNFSTVHFDWFANVIEQVPLDLKAVDASGQSRSLDPSPDQSCIDLPRLIGRRPQLEAVDCVSCAC
jgi:hypothetical protein